MQWCHDDNNDDKNDNAMLLMLLLLPLTAADDRSPAASCSVYCWSPPSVHEWTSSSATPLPVSVAHTVRLFHATAQIASETDNQQQHLTILMSTAMYNYNITGNSGANFCKTFKVFQFLPNFNGDWIKCLYLYKWPWTLHSYDLHLCK